MKKIIIAVIAVLLLLGLVACGEEALTYVDAKPYNEEVVAEVPIEAIPDILEEIVPPVVVPPPVVVAPPPVVVAPPPVVVAPPVVEISKTEKVIAEGYKLLGTPYVYGAVRYHDGQGHLLKNFDIKKFDCSSFTQYIYYKGAGVLLGTTTRTQVLQGTSVTKAKGTTSAQIASNAKTSLKRGDLLFFTNASRQNNTGIERVGHVAVYLGDNLILHTASTVACVEQISTARWNYFIEARRVL